MKDLKQVLFEFDDVHLRAIARERGIPCAEATHAELVDALAPELSAPKSLERAVQGLMPGGRAALRALLIAGGRSRAHLFQHTYGRIRRFGPNRLERERPWESPSGPAEELWYKGLIGRGFAQDEGETVEFIFIPRDILPTLQALVSPVNGEAQGIPLEPDPPPARPVAWEDAGLLLAYSVLQHVQLHRPRPAGEERFSEDDIRRMWETWASLEKDAAARRPEPGALDLIVHLLRRLDVLRVRDGRWALHPPRARQWLKKSPAAGRRTLLEGWAASPEWNDLWHVPSLRPEPAGWENDPLATRRRFLRHLQGLEPGAWYRLDRFIALIKETDADFQRPDADYETWYIHDAESGQPLRGFEHWDAVEGALIRYYLTGPLFWLGGTALGSLQSEGPASHAEVFALTPAGARFLAGKPEEEEAIPDVPVKIDADLTIRVEAGAPLYYPFQLARFAEPQGDRSYRITAGSLLTARTQGLGMEAILRFLESISGAALAEDIKAALAHLWEGALDVHAERLIALQFSQPETPAWLEERFPHFFEKAQRLPDSTILLPEVQAGRLLRQASALGIPLRVRRG